MNALEISTVRKTKLREQFAQLQKEVAEEAKSREKEAAKLVRARNRFFVNFILLN